MTCLHVCLKFSVVQNLFFIARPQKWLIIFKLHLETFWTIRNGWMVLPKRKPWRKWFDLEIFKCSRRKIKTDCQQFKAANIDSKIGYPDFIFNDTEMLQRYQDVSLLCTNAWKYAFLFTLEIFLFKVSIQRRRLFYKHNDNILCNNWKWFEKS